MSPILQEANITLGVISNLAEAIPVDDGLHVTYHSVMGVEIPKVHYTEQKMDFCYGMEYANSKLADHRIEKVEDACKIGDMMWVKVTDIDEKGRVNLSHKDAVKEIKAKEAAGERIK